MPDCLCVAAVKMQIDYLRALLRLPEKRIPATWVNVEYRIAIHRQQ
jgi:hypothetical protein